MLDFTRSPAAFWLLLASMAVVGGAGQASAQALDSTLTKRFQLADSYFRAGQFDRAVGLLEDLYRQSPNTFAFSQKLKDAYENLKRYDEAIAIIEDQMSRTPVPVYLAEKARFLYMKGDEEGAHATWNDAIDLRPDDRISYRTVSQSMAQARLIREAIGVLERGRERLGAGANLHADLAALYSADGDLERAMQEYVLLLIQEPEQLPLVRSRLARVSEDADQLRAALVVVERAVRQDPLVEPLRELAAWMYMEVGNYLKALDTFRALDRLGDQDGRALYAFAQQASEAGAFEAGVEAFSELLTRYPNGPIAPEALFGLAAMHQKWAEHLGQRGAPEADADSASAHLNLALEIYRQFLEKYQRHPFYPNALFALANIQNEVLDDLDAAETLLRRLVSERANHPVAKQADFELGIIALKRNRLTQARAIFQRVEEELATGELAERARFELALSYLYGGDVETALTMVAAVNRNTSTDVANDAIELRLLLTENKGPDSLNSALQGYGRLLFMRRQNRAAEALSLADTLLGQFGNHAITDELHFTRAELLQDSGDPHSSWVAFAELPLLHPQSPLVDLALFKAAQILDFELGEASEAIKYYNRLLSEYPGSIYAADARSRIRSLRGDGA